MEYTFICPKCKNTYLTKAGSKWNRVGLNTLNGKLGLTVQPFLILRNII